MWGSFDDFGHFDVFDVLLKMPRTRRRPNFRQLSDFEPGRIVVLREGGLSFRQIAARLNRSVSAVLNCYHVWSEEGREQRARRSGRPRQTTASQDRRLRLLAVRDRFSTTRSIADQWFGEEGRRVSTRTIYRRIRSFRLMSYRPYFVLPLTAAYKRQRLEWCQERLQWDEEWHQYIPLKLF
jgi:transposase